MEEMVIAWRHAVKDLMPGISDDAVEIMMAQALESLSHAGLTIMPMVPTIHLQRILSGALHFMTKKEPSESTVLNLWGAILKGSLKDTNV